MAGSERTYDSAPIVRLFEGVPAPVVAEIAGVTTRTVVRWRCGGRIGDEWAADRLATHRDQHPAMIWPDWGG